MHDLGLFSLRDGDSRQRDGDVALGLDFDTVEAEGYVDGDDVGRLALNRAVHCIGDLGGRNGCDDHLGAGGESALGRLDAHLDTVCNLAETLGRHGGLFLGFLLGLFLGLFLGCLLSCFLSCFLRSFLGSSLVHSLCLLVLGGGFDNGLLDRDGRFLYRGLLDGGRRLFGRSRLLGRRLGGLLLGGCSLVGIGRRVHLVVRVAERA